MDMDDTLPIMTIQQIGHHTAGDTPGSQRNGLGRHPIPEVVGHISNSISLYNKHLRRRRRVQETWDTS